MPCMKCGYLLIYLYDEATCPKCEKLRVLDSDTAIKVATRLVSLATKIFNDELGKWERDTLLGILAAKRELYSRQFFRKHSILNVDHLTELTLLIKRAAQFGCFRGKTPLETSEIDKVINAFHSLKRFEDILLNVKTGIQNILYFKVFDENSFTLQEAKETFKVFTNEKFPIREKIFAGYNVYPEEKAEQEFTRLNEGESADTGERKYELLPPQEFIQKYYQPFIVPFFALFHRDRLSAECFQLDYLEKILAEPRDIIEFIATNFKLFEDDTLTASPTHIFVKKASKYFGITKKEVKRLLVFDVNNKSICPIFIRFRNEDLGDNVCISKDFCRFIYTILHSTLTKVLFDNETVRLSKEFETKKVKAEFEKIGYIYEPNVTDKRKATLEIDGLAVKDRKCYVVECKGLRLKRLMDEPDTLNYIIRDLERHILGKEYTTNRNGQVTVRNKPSLINKVEFVKQNVSTLGAKYGFDPNITEFEGVIVTMDYPPITEYNGVKILSIHQIPGLS